MASYVKRRCAGCQVLFVPARANQKHCSQRCRRRVSDRAAYRRRRDAALGVVSGRVSRATSVDGRASARRGERYEEFCRSGWPERLAPSNGRPSATNAQAAMALGTSQENVSHWLAAFLEDELAEKRRVSWSRSSDAEGLLADFERFRRSFFEDEWGKPYVTESFHLRWISALLEAMGSGGRLMILSPPRHGKTQLLIHFCVWQIIRNPNIRLVWIGLNEDNAKEAVGAVRDILENHEGLRGAMLGPEGSWKPVARSGKSWTDATFTVATREGVGIKSPTMRAIGKGGKLLSKDADVIVCDDIQDKEAYESPASRAADIRWMNSQVASRKEAHSALLVIGSRQHHEDLYGRLAENVMWSSIVESAHSLECSLPVHGARSDHASDCPECAVHDDCVLWPSKRTMAFLQDQRFAMEDDLMFEMVYLNRTRPSGADYLTIEHLHACRSLRRIGRVPPGTMLIAGMDPSRGASGFQASMLWAVDLPTKKRYLVDLDEARGGGLLAAEHIIRRWHGLYGLKLWVVETNYFQDSIRQHVPIVQFTAAHGITLLPHETNRWNKWDRYTGVPVQMALFRQQLVDLPGGDEDSRLKLQPYEKELVSFEPPSGDGSRRVKRKENLVMAGWFPETQIRLWLAEMSADIVDDHDMAGYTSLRFGDGYTSTLGELVGS